MNKRRTLLALLALGAAPLASAQPAGKAWRIGVLRGASDDVGFRRNFEPFRQALRDQGFTEGANVTFEYRVRPGTPEEILALASGLARAKVDAILAIATAGVSAAASATKSIPIVAVDLESDPVAQKFAVSLARPGGNVTGLFLDFPELSGKWIELLRLAFPKLSRAAVIFDPTIGPYLLKGAESAGVSMRVQLARLEARNSTELRGAFESAAIQKAEAVLALSSPVFLSARKEIADLAIMHRLPTIMPFPIFVDDGGFMAYGPHLTSMFRQAGGVMAKILRGAQPREIPIERPTRFELAINLRTARALGIAVPPALTVRADRVIE